MQTIQMDHVKFISRPTWRGALIGTLVGLLMIVVAVLSSGAGHGSYIAARALFPLSMLLTLFEENIGPVAIGAGLVQFSLYGALIGQAMASKKYRAVCVAAASHVVASLACFSGILSNFA